MKLVKDLYFPDDDIWMSEEYKQGHTQLDRLHLALIFCTKTRNAVDAGAHVGIFSREMAQVFDAVWSFEPNPETYNCLVINTLKFPNIYTQRAALSDKLASYCLKYDERHKNNTGGAYVDFSEGNVYTTVLDQYALMDVDLIKGDIEGHELYMLRGGVETIKRSWPVILVEEKSRLMKRQAVPGDGVRKFLSDLGYVLAAKSHSDFIYVKGV